MVAADGDHYRRVVPSPRPQSILQIEQIKAMLGASDSLVVCCGGGGVPMVRTTEGRLEGVEAVIDKDLCSSLLAQQVRHPPPPQPPTPLPPTLTMGGVGAAGCGWADHPDGWRRHLGELWEA